MADMTHNLLSEVKAKKDVKIGIAASQYNTEISNTLLESCQDELVDRGVAIKNIDVLRVPGAFELPLACKKMADSKKYDAIIALGAVIRGETPHFDFIAFEAAHGIMKISLKYTIPVIFGVLTTDNLKQAKARIRNGNKGDKGVEAAITALEMLHLKI